MRVHYLGEDGQPMCNVPVTIAKLGINPGEITCKRCLKQLKPCGAIRKQVGKYAVCVLDAGHKSAHWDSELRISWNEKQVVDIEEVR